MTRNPEVFPVGEFIRDELDERGMFIDDLAKAMDGDFEHNYCTLELLIHAPIKGATLDQETAEKLAKVFETSPEFWLNLDKTWRTTMIELRPDTVPDAQKGDLDEVIGHNVDVHLETLSDDAIMLIVEDSERHVHLRITKQGRGPMRVWVLEEFELEAKDGAG